MRAKWSMLFGPEGSIILWPKGAILFGQRGQICLAFPQVIVHLLVTDYRENFAVRQFPVIFLQDGFGNIQQADIGSYVCLVPFLDYP